MPIVDYNRIYRVRSQERKPITNPVTGPDAAGAFLRGAVPAALAPMHGLNARIDAIRGETDARNRRDALRLEGIASGIRAAGDAYQTYIRAMERRDAAELDKLEAAYSAHMISGADGAYGTRRETSDGKVTNGPGAAIRQLDRDFEETDAYKAANRRVKNAFAPRREARRAVYFAKGDRIQFEAARAEHAQAVKDKADNDDIAVSRNLDPYNYRTWKEQMEIAIESDQHQLRLGMGLVEMQADGTERAVREPTEEERRTLANQRLAKRDAYILQRALYYGNLIANDDGTLSQTPHLETVLEAIANDAGLSVGQNADDGMPDSDVAFANEAIASPLVRQKIGEILTNARQSRERNVAAKDSLAAHQASDTITLVQCGDVPDDKLEDIRAGIADGIAVITKPGLQAKLLDDADAAIATRKAINWLTRYNADGADRTAMLEEYSKLPDGREKDILTRQLYGGSAAATRWTPTNANNLLAAGEKPADVIEQAQRAVTDGAMSGEDYRKVQDSVRAKVNFDRLAGERSGEFLAGIVGAVDDAFGVRIGDILELDRKTGLPKCDGEGNPIPARGYNPANTRRSTVGRTFHTVEARTLSGVREVEDSPGIRVADSAMLEAVRLGMEYVSQRLSGFDGKGNKGSGPAPTPDTVRGELAEYFRTVLAEQGADLSSEMLSIAILSARERAETLGTPPSLRAAWDEQHRQNNRYSPQ